MKLSTIGVAMLAGAMLAGCGKEEKVVVCVNGKALTESRLAADVEKIIQSQGANIPAGEQEQAREGISRRLVQDFMFESVLLAKAQAESFQVTDADRKEQEAELLKQVARMPNAPKTYEEWLAKFPLGPDRGREQFENGVLIGKMIKSYKDKAPKTDHTAEAKKILDGIVSNNVAAAKAAVEAESKIKALKQQLDAIKDVTALTNKFAELAKANSACPSSSKGGALGEFTHGQMVREFDEVAFKLPVGKVSDPVKTQFGWHLILVTQKTPAVAAKGDKPAEEEKVSASHILIKAARPQPAPKLEDIVKHLSRQDEGAFMRKFVMDLVENATITASEEYQDMIPKAKPADHAACGDACNAPAAKEKAAAPVEKPAKK